MSMLCQICGKTAATVHFTEIHDNKMTEIHVCERCAEEKGLHTPTQSHKFDIADLLAGMVDSMTQNDEERVGHVQCPRCGLLYSQFRETGRVGSTTPPIAEVPGVTNVPAPAVAEEPPPKRIVQREGIVWGTFSIQSPTRFALVSPDNHKTINYLHTISRNLDLSRYKGLRIVVTGEEGLDERWRNTPIITIQKIQVVD